MKHQLNINTWNRREHFHFFRQFEEPFFGVSLNLDVTKAYQTAKSLDTSFFLYYLHQSLVAANAVEAFRYRIENETEVAVYDSINASPTINREDGTFGFGYMSYHADYQIFALDAKKEMERVRANSGLELTASNDNVIHYSLLPWLNFTSLSHARSFSFKDCIPKISFGKMIDSGGKKSMPVSIHVHHALVDGAQVGAFVELFQAGLDTF
jgi:chloramphenicol O-acetyltransferase type A